MYSWKRRHCGVGERVWQGADTNHAEDLKAVVFER